MRCETAHSRIVQRSMEDESATTSAHGKRLLPVSILDDRQLRGRPAAPGRECEAMQAPQSRHTAIAPGGGVRRFDGARSGRLRDVQGPPPARADS